ncbi:insulin-like [Neosynchiropus ocellatus]
MVALWVHSTSLLVVLLVISYPGSEANPAQHLCGSHLVDALNLVCGDRGFYYNPRRDAENALGEGAGENEIGELGFKDKMDVMVKRQIVEQCCKRRCTIFDLDNYCN